MKAPSKPGLYKVKLGDGGPFPYKVVRWTGSAWRHARGWPAYNYLRKWIVSWEPFSPDVYRLDLELKIEELKIYGLESLDEFSVSEKRLTDRVKQLEETVIRLRR